jgi:hypothetical protein
VAWARALGAFLQANGFPGGIRVFGFGPRCPLALAADYSEDERNRILRRVEVLRMHTLPPGYCGGAAADPG